MPEQVVFRDREMTTIWGNKAAADWLHITPEEMVGRRCYEARYGRKEPCEDCDVAKSMDTGEPGENETTSPDGRVWSNRYSPVRDEAGGIIGVVETTLDITERKRAEEELTKYRNLVEERVETGTNESKKKGRSRGR